MKHAAVLFDVGGPIDMEERHEALIDRDLQDALAAEGFPCDEAAFREANDLGIASFAPNLYQAIAWRLTGCRADACERVLLRVEAGARRRLAERGGVELRPGIAGLLQELHAEGVRLALAANQPAWMVEELERVGLAGLFDSLGLSGRVGYRKPDPRLLLAVAGELGVEPGACIMVGDRVDNDIVPARLLGMATVRLRTGRHRAQQPRSPAETPDAEVNDVPGLRRALVRLRG